MVQAHPPPLFRAVRASDDLVALTDLIHAAYAPHAAGGLRYWATHQSVDDTAKRLAAGLGLVAERAGEIIATITLRKPEPGSPVDLLREASTWSFGQFCVSPNCKGQGVGRALHDHALQVAAGHGARRMALHTAQPATALIAMYTAWGYAEAGTCDWRPHTNYLSVLMTKPLRA